MNDLIRIIDELRIKPKEEEWFEFKKNKNLSGQDIGEYISALSNSAGLVNQPFGYLIWGISDKNHEIVGTTINLKEKKEGNVELEFWLNLNLNPKINFSIHQFEYKPDTKIALIKINAPNSQPVKFKGIAYIRIDSNKTELKNYPERERLLWNLNFDWSSQICENVSIEDLDKIALKIAKTNFRQRSENKLFYDEIENWETSIFLDKAKLTLNSKITRTALLLLGNEHSKHHLYSDLNIIWVFVDEKGIKRYSELFEPPFLLATDKVINKIRNEKIRILPRNSSIPLEKYKYDNWIIREALNNCIAHQDYTKESRIIVTEKLDELRFFNAGTFFQGAIEDYILSDFTPPKYRNPFLVNAMVNLGMIETIGSGIKKMFSLQREHFLPLPDYSLTENVELKIYGSIISQEYTQTLIEKPDLDLGTVFLLDKLQKVYPISDNDYLHIIIHYLKQQKRATRDNINQLLSDLLPTNLVEKQKTDKVKNLIYKLSKDGIIKNISTSRKNPIWTLAK
jgi:ATP-dependent DNA helicase RecG